MFRKAERSKAKLRLGICGPSGSGKTYSALLIAMGLGGKIAIADTENKSADLYAHLCDYDVCEISHPYSIDKYMKAIDAAEEAGYDVLILDSISHAWAGEGGLLDQQGAIADSGRGNSYTAWRKVTPLHNRFIERMLNCNLHLIATMRSKTEYILTEDAKGKQVPKKVGMAPIQRDGMDYEFTAVLDLDHSHHAQSSKDRTGLFDGKIFIPSKKTGQELIVWLETGKDVPITEQHQPTDGDVPNFDPITEHETTIKSLKKELSGKMRDMPPDQKVKFFEWKMNGSVTIDALQDFIDNYQEYRDSFLTGAT